MLALYGTSFVCHLSFCSFLNLPPKLINHPCYSKAHTVPMPSYVRYALCLKYDVLPCLHSAILYVCSSVEGRHAQKLLPHVAVADGVHGQQVVAVSELEVDDFQSCFHLGRLSGSARPTLPHHVLEQQAVLADSLHRLEQVRPQVHLVAQLQLLLLK